MKPSASGGGGVASQRPARGQRRARRGEFVFPSMPFAIGMFIISKNWSFRDGTQPPQTSATGGSSQCPLTLGGGDPHRCPVPAQGPTEPRGSSIPRACPGGVRAACPRPVSPRRHGKPGSGEGRAVAFSVVWRQRLPEFSFLLFGQKAKQNSEKPSEKMVQLGFRWDLFPSFSHCFAFRVSSPPQLPTLGDGAETPHQSSSFIFATS